MLLSALGILFVIDSHVGPNFSSYLIIFPYDSFFMPMFAFISGYFFSEKHIQSWNHLYRYIFKKAFTLLVPYFLWIIFYGIVTALLRYFDLLEIGQDSFIDLIHNIATGGTSFSFNDPSWFVPLLFCVVAGYGIIRKVFEKHWNHYTAMAIFALLGAAVTALSRTDFRTNNTFMLLKIPAFLQYYHMAVLFREKLEKKFDKLHPILICSLAAAVNVILICIYGKHIYIPMYATMGGYELNAPFVPLIAAIAGIAFWLKICKVLAPLLGHSKLLNFISDNTFFFMTHHLAVKHIWLALLLLLQRAGKLSLPGFDMSQYRQFGWYSYYSSFTQALLCLLFTVSVLISICKIYQQLLNLVCNTIKAKKQP